MRSVSASASSASRTSAIIRRICSIAPGSVVPASTPRTSRAERSTPRCDRPWPNTAAYTRSTRPSSRSSNRTSSSPRPCATCAPCRRTACGKCSGRAESRRRWCRSTRTRSTEILASVTQVARAAGSPDTAREAGGSLRSRLDAVRAAVRDAGPPRVLGIEWFDPPFAPGHWVPEMIELAGGRNLAGEAGSPSREVSWEEIGSARSGRAPPHALRLRAGGGAGRRRRPCGVALTRSRAARGRVASRLGLSTPPPTSTARVPASSPASRFSAWIAAPGPPPRPGPGGRRRVEPSGLKAFRFWRGPSRTPPSRSADPESGPRRCPTRT